MCFYGSLSDNLTMEDLIMFNRYQCGLHHPSNDVPCCKSCNKRLRHSDKKIFLLGRATGSSL